MLILSGLYDKIFLKTAEGYVMKISTEFGSSARKVGEEKAIELIAKAGFDAWDFSMFDMCDYDYHNNHIIKTNHPFQSDNYLSFARRLKKIGLDNGIVCNQSHAPFPARSAEIRSYFKRAIECTAEAGGEIVVIHPNNDFSPQENAEMYMEFLPFAKEYGVKIATENMWNWNGEANHAAPAACSSPENFCEHLKAIDDPFFVACLDIGHAEMKGLDTNSYEMIKALGDKLQALHIHDNDLVNDNHQIPFSMNIDFDAMVKGLKEINYKGYFTLECGCYLDKFNSENLLQGLKDMADSAKKLAHMFENI